MPFAAPVRDLGFALDVVGLPALAAAGFPECDRATMEAVLAAGASVADDVLAPLNRIGDREGARLENGRVIAAPGFVDAYRTYADGGWLGLTASPAHGGQGLPRALSLAVSEMVDAANMAFGLCPMLSAAAIEALAAHGTARQQALHLPRLISGEWTGTMNLTEPQAGSDLSQVRCLATPAAQGGYRLTGQKIYITWGDHDLTENVVHLVLARTPGAPEGVRGISLFLATQRLVDDSGRIGVANAIRVGGIEHKLGIHASPTCTMLFEDAQAELVGREHEGLAHMFTMMNAARLHVGVQGVAIAERAYQQAREFARERRQGRSVWSGDKIATIADQPDVRRMLMLMRAKIEAARCLCLATGIAADVAHTAPEAETRDAARMREELLTPVAKAWATDIGVEVASLGVQVHGGMGFVEETGAAQHYRDARIAPIYEGTNGIQAMDLVGRKLGLGQGAALATLVDDMRQTAASLDRDLARLGEQLARAAHSVEEAGAWLMQRRGSPDALAGATTFLRLLGETVGGWMHARLALAAREASGDPAWLASKALTARFYGDQVLTTASALAVQITSGADDLASWAA